MYRYSPPIGILAVVLGAVVAFAIEGTLKWILLSLIASIAAIAMVALAEYVANHRVLTAEDGTDRRKA